MLSALSPASSAARPLAKKSESEASGAARAKPARSARVMGGSGARYTALTPPPPLPQAGEGETGARGLWRGQASGGGRAESAERRERGGGPAGCQPAQRTPSALAA